jgi:anti-sigma factor RsiW
MSQHDSIRELLPLAAADALSPEEQRRVEAHLRECEACRRELDGLERMTAALRRIPTPQPSAALIERARIIAERALLERAERQWDYRVVAFLLLFSWTLTLAAWPLVRLVSGGIFDWAGIAESQTWFWLAGYTVLGWLAAGVATVVLGLRQRALRRLT